jgi:hypothetical protein
MLPGGNAPTADKAWLGQMTEPRPGAEWQVLGVIDGIAAAYRSQSGAAVKASPKTSANGKAIIIADAKQLVVERGCRTTLRPSVALVSTLAYSHEMSPTAIISPYDRMILKPMRLGELRNRLAHCSMLA